MGIKQKGVFFPLEESQPERQESLFRWLRHIIGLERRPKQIQDIQEVIDESEERGLISQEEGDMIEGIFDLKQTVAREIMIPRTHLVSVSKDSTLDQVLQTIIESGYSRIPVYRDNMDQVIGILNAKDLLPLWLNGEKELHLENLIRQPFFVPETKQIKDLLNELRNKKSHLAVIVDEYGGTSGIVTIEDIIEEIIGEIRDEHDTEEELFLPQEDGSVLVKALANLDDFEEYFEVQLPRGGYDTLGGFIIQLVGKVPGKGEEILFGGLRMKIQGGDQKRITRVTVLPEGASKEADPSADHDGTAP
jgi:CBS domain containing-hemolysin-like protein